MSYKNGSKLEVLKAVRDNKELLFGSFSDTLTKNDKVQKWMEIHDHAKALGLVPHTKDYKYTRDVFWQNIRKNTMKKVDNKRQTGSEGGPSFKYTEIDNVVLDIMGKESPSVIGLPVAETWGNDLKSTAVNQKTTSTHPEEDSLMPTNDSDDLVKECTGTKRYAKKEDSFQELKIKKLKLSVELMEKDSYLKSLEILKLERELSLPPSQYTAQFCNETLYYYEANNNTEEVVIENVNKM